MKKILQPLCPFFIVILLWEVLLAKNIIDKSFFPGPLQTLLKLTSLMHDQDFLVDIRSSLYRLFIGSILSIIVSLFLCFLCLKSKRINSFITPLIGFTFPLPKVALMPLLMLIFGIGESYKVAVIFLGMFFLLFINLQKSSHWLQTSSLADVTKIFQIKGYAYFRNVFLKGVWLDFLVGLKSALGYGLTLVVVSEFTASKNGIGNFIWKAWDQFRILDLYAAIYFLGILGFVLYSFLDYLIEKKTTYYSQF